ncbi:DEAD/DEAH box helicase family protein [Histomonas meleagridis]|uniref:DEAD/DEAH box helicase family protein n=1 Tax=Histomonas meleagridis TaxID=135588 RepID=UPI0035595240|nr:DEAD/DEAH box helicase family protein [Histomonas meleagridis]KAH0800976.1 DEAD/DEAH box helicase family protein [Histomonas meleagridis]
MEDFVDSLVKTLDYEYPGNTDEFLIPPMRLSSQRYVGIGDTRRPIPEFEPNVLRYDPTPPTMTIEPIRNLITGEIEGFCDTPISSSIDDNSTNRPLTNIDDYHRGSSTGVAFTPGGFLGKTENEKEQIDVKPFLASLETGMDLLFTPLESEKVNIESSEQLPPLPDLPQINPAPVPKPMQKRVAEATKQYSVIDDWDTSLFATEIPNPALTFSFKLDAFQLRAIHRLELGQTVFVSAPTSAGKTVIAQYAIALCRAHKMKVIYTSPIKALSNQKFRDLSKQFGDVGLLTGDVSLNRDASCLIITTEILRSMLYHGADLLRDVECVIFDECHYISNDERGVVWEESIILLPYHINMVFLSATVPNAMEIADWIGRTKQKIVYVQNHTVRPVPIEHALYTGDSQFYVIAQGNRPMDHFQLYKAQLSIKGSPGYIDFSPQYWMNLVLAADKAKLLPMLIFCFSQKMCEQLATGILPLDLLTKSEKKHVKGFCIRSLRRLTKEDRELPQIQQVLELLEHGIGIHHGGILPIVKEIVEILLTDGYVKVLFCTSTFGMGLNVPARSCAFLSLEKFNGRIMSNLTPTEYVQMSGRAGRRGKDTIGTSIILCHGEIPDPNYLQTLISGKVEALQSQFYLKFNMILNLLRVKDIKMVDLLRHSLSANLTQLMMPELVRKKNEIEKQLKTLPKSDCIVPDIEDISEFGDYYLDLKENNQWMLEQIDSRSIMGQLRKGRIVYVLNDLPTLAIISENPQNKNEIKAISSNGNKITFSLNEIGAIFSKVIKSSEKMTQNNIQKLLCNFKDSPISWMKILSTSDYEFATAAQNQINIYSNMVKSPCFKCSLLKQHLELYVKKVNLLTEKDEIETQMKDESLTFKPLLDLHIEILKKLNYISEENVLMLKGRVSIEISSCHEILGTELLFSGVFDDLSPKEIAAALAALVSEGIVSNDSDDFIPPSLEEPLNEMTLIAKELFDEFQKVGIPLDDRWVDNNVNLTLVQAVFDWADGLPFKHIMCITDVPEGSVVRIINRIGELTKDFANATKIMGCRTLSEKFEQAGELIKRDIIFASSLYFD